MCRTEVTARPKGPISNANRNVDRRRSDPSLRADIAGMRSRPGGNGLIDDRLLGGRRRFRCERQAESAEIRS